MSIRRMMLFTLGRFFKSIMSLFKTRVLSDGGILEAETNLENQLNTLGSDLFDSASLVITPNAFKEQTLYSIKPTEGYTNLILQSENFAVSPWFSIATPNVTKTGNAGTAPDGTNTATLITSNTELAARGIRQNITLFPTQKQYIFSCWVRSDDSAVIIIDIGDSGTQTFNLTPTWERVSVLSTPSSSGFVDIAFTSNQLGKTFYIWGGQLEEGTTPGNYIKTTTRPILKGTIGDLGVTRATTATRVNEQGLIEPVPYNLFSYSEDFGNSFWTKNNSTVTTNTNQTMSPIGTNTVDLYIPNTTLGEHHINPAFISSTSLFINSTNIYNWSVYVKSAGNNFFLLRVYINGTWSSVVFNLSSSSIVSTHPNFISAKIELVNDGWQLLSCVFTGVNGINVFQHISSPTGDIVFSGNGTSGAYIWGAQLTIGTSKREYFATTDRLNVARIDYTTGSPAILAEPQRTNLLYPSNVATTQIRAVTAVQYALSFYGTGTVTLSGAFSGSLTGTGVNDRVSLIFTPADGNLTLTVTGTVVNWQLEAGSNSTSYIPTLSGSVTRNTDNINKSGISSLIGQTEGSIFCEFERTTETAGQKHLLTLYGDGYLTNSLFLNTSNNLTNLNLAIRINSTAYQFSFATLIGKNKVALIYDTTGCDVFLNGTKLTRLSLPSFPSLYNLSLLQYTTTRQYGSVYMLSIWKTKLTDQQAIQLTIL